MGTTAQGRLRPIDDAYPKLLLALDSQVRLVLELESLGQSQRHAIEMDDAEATLTLVGGRQALIDQLTALDREAAVLRGDVEGQGPRVTAAQREEISRRAGAVARGIQRVMAADAVDSNALRRRRAEISSELSEVSGMRRAVSAYGGGVPGAAPEQGAMFQDRRG